MTTTPPTELTTTVLPPEMAAAHLALPLGTEVTLQRTPHAGCKIRVQLRQHHGLYDHHAVDNPMHWQRHSRHVYTNRARALSLTATAAPSLRFIPPRIVHYSRAATTCLAGFRVRAPYSDVRDPRAHDAAIAEQPTASAHHWHIAYVDGQRSANILSKLCAVQARSCVSHLKSAVSTPFEGSRLHVRTLPEHRTRLALFPVHASLYLLHMSALRRPPATHSFAHRPFCICLHCVVRLPTAPFVHCTVCPLASRAHRPRTPSPSATFMWSTARCSLPVADFPHPAACRHYSHPTATTCCPRLPAAFIHCQPHPPHRLLHELLRLHAAHVLHKTHTCILLFMDHADDTVLMVSTGFLMVVYPASWSICIIGPAWSLIVLYFAPTLALWRIGTPVDSQVWLCTSSARPPSPMPAGER
ncbi:hypothetical protein GGX14DRAFT_571792 [Mycena pura]|uniref:Uncharacterized protein n=1 Tax=Mycena pura TaxID=153505 RepID=A0AAD6V209_9AGAR|nr:hypothetical protein GGX14DRAFT_571792 [Mycena pura]